VNVFLDSATAGKGTGSDGKYVVVLIAFSLPKLERNWSDDRELSLLCGRKIAPHLHFSA